MQGEPPNSNMLSEREKDVNSVDGPPNSPVDACISSLNAMGLMDEADSRRAEAARNSGESLPAAAVRIGLIPPSAFTTAALDATGWPLLDADEAATLDKPPATGAPQASFLKSRLAIVAPAPEGLIVALADPFDEGLKRAIEMSSSGPIAYRVAEGSTVIAWRRTVLEGGQRLTAPSTEAASGEAVEAMEALLEQAARLGASDLHFEPSPTGGRARARVDGAMREIGTLTSALYPSAVARAKVLARLDVAERRLPQDGRARLELAGRPIDLRLSTAPALDGETLAIRLLDPEGAPGKLSALGFPDEYEAVLRGASKAPHGLFLLTGPTGAGKTTTLHAALSELNASERKIMTVEDPIEYALPGVVQMQVKTDIGFDFASAQRTMLRHNPDIMMVGEIRDTTSAAIAIQAALTGHLVFSTVHANSAAGAAIRLLDLGVEPFLLSAALIGAGAQRLARCVCPDCAVPGAPAPEALSRIGAPKDGAYRRAQGCHSCGQTGAKGRVAVAEAFLAPRSFAEAVRAPSPSETGLGDLTGATPLWRAALDLAARGEISLDEAIRVAPQPTA